MRSVIINHKLNHKDVRLLSNLIFDILTCCKDSCTELPILNKVVRPKFVDLTLKHYGRHLLILSEENLHKRVDLFEKQLQDYRNYPKYHLPMVSSLIYAIDTGNKMLVSSEILAGGLLRQIEGHWEKLSRKKESTSQPSFFQEKSRNLVSQTAIEMALGKKFMEIYSNDISWKISGKDHTATMQGKLLLKEHQPYFQKKLSNFKIDFLESKQRNNYFYLVIKQVKPDTWEQKQKQEHASISVTSNQ